MNHSLTGSKQPTHPWLAILIKEDDCLELNILDSTPFLTGTSVGNNITEVQENSNNSSRTVTVTVNGV